MKDSGMITDCPMTDWGIIAFPTDLDAAIVDNSADHQLQFFMGLAGSDLTLFTEYCYEIIDEIEQTWTGPEDYGGCPAPILKYYDGFFLGLYVNYYSDDAYETYYFSTLYLYDDYYFYICPGE